MLTIKNYRDIPRKDRDVALQEVFRLGFLPAYGKQATVKREMERSQAGTLPQFLFLFHGSSLVGYVFLIAEAEGYSAAFPWWAIHNLDELQTRGEDISPVFEYVIGLCEEYGTLKLKSRVEADPTYAKMKK